MARIFIIIVACSMLITQAASSCPRGLGCRCEQAAAVDNLAGTDVDCANQYRSVFPSSMPTDTLNLDFSRNSLDRVPNKIKLLPQLRQLNLSNNGIHYDVQDNIFENSVELRILDLSGNRISSFRSNALVGLERLQVLDVHNNLFVSIPVDVFRPLPSMVTICIGDNHWDCDCDLYHSLVQRFLVAQGDASTTCRGGDPECTTPYGLYGKLFSDISGEEELCVPEEEQSTSMGSTLPPFTAALTTDVIKVDLVLSTSNASTQRGFTTASRSVVSTTSGGGRNQTNATPLGLAVAGQENGGGLFLNQEIVTYGVIVVGGMVLIIFLLLTVLFSRMVSKRRCASRDSDSEESSSEHAEVSPWPLLQSERQLPAIVLGESDFTCGNSDYQEIPVKFIERDYRDYRGAKDNEVDEFPGGSVYMTSIGNGGGQLPTPNTSTQCTDGYIPMHAPIPLHGPLKQGDLYAPCETQNGIC